MMAEDSHLTSSDIHRVGFGRHRRLTSTIKGLALGGIISVITVFLPVMALTAFGDEKPPIRIGATISLEGKYQEPSLMLRNGLELWAKQVNERGGLLGRPVKLILYDDHSKPELVRPLYEKLVKEDKVDLVFSPYGSNLAMLASEVTERHRLVMIGTIAGETVFQRGYKYIFSVYAPAGRYLIGFLDLMARQGLGTVAIIYENSSFPIGAAKGGQEWADRFGIKVKYFKAYNQGPAELPGLLTEALGTAPDGLILCAYSTDCYDLMKLLQAVKARPQALCMTVAPAQPLFYEQAGSTAEGVFGPSQWEPDALLPFPGIKEFIESYKNFTQQMPSYHAAAAYAAAQVLEQAITKTQSLNQEKIRDYILSLDTVTVCGRFRVDSTGMQVGHNSILIQWQNGKKEIVYPSTLQTAPARF
jgi:branched-chain amino acid transport system substrate-binding protein